MNLGGGKPSPYTDHIMLLFHKPFSKGAGSRRLTED